MTQESKSLFLGLDLLGGFWRISLRLVPTPGRGVFVVSAWMAAIFALSSINGHSFPEVGPGPDWSYLAHACLYAGLAWWILVALFRWGIRGGHAMAWCVVLCVAYGLSDEIHQTFVPNRTCSALDVAADGGGALLSVMLWRMRQKSPRDMGSRGDKIAE